MTIGVLNPVKSERMAVISTRENDHPIECSDVSHINRSRVKRCLFGQVDHDELLEHVKKEFTEVQERQKRKWGFDFVSEKPLDPPKNYVWERIIHQPKAPCTSSSFPDEDNKIIINDNDGKRADDCPERTNIAANECCIKYRQTTINEYWRCTKRSSECLQCYKSAKMKSTNLSTVCSPASLVIVGDEVIDARENCGNKIDEDFNNLNNDNDNNNNNNNNSINVNKNTNISINTDNGSSARRNDVLSTTTNPNKRFCKVSCAS